VITQSNIQAAAELTGEDGQGAGKELRSCARDEDGQGCTAVSHDSMEKDARRGAGMFNIAKLIIALLLFVDEEGRSRR